MSGQFQLGKVTPSQYFFSIAVLLGLLFALVEPDPIDPDQALPAWQVFVRWQLQSLLPMALMVFSHMALARWPKFDHLSPWLALAISGMLGASLFTPLALWIDLTLTHEAPPTSWIGELIEEWLNMMPPVTLCWLAINAPWILGFSVQKSATVTPATTPDANDTASAQPTAQPLAVNTSVNTAVGPAVTISANTETARAADTEFSTLDSLDPALIEEPAFMQLVPAEKRGELIFLQAELHYLNVVTTQGKTLILYNLKDAISELGSQTGLQTHRSYWVAKSHIQTLHKQGRQGEVVVTGNHRIPVSRRNFSVVNDFLSNHTK